MIPTHLISALSTLADQEINRALKNGAPGQKPPTGEVGLVAAFVLGAVPNIALAWRPLLRPHGLSVQMTGVFCHQAPRASFADAGNIPRVGELSDLLVVVEDLTTGVSTRRWAALIQAKMANAGRGANLSRPGDLVQLDLMMRWPRFTLPGAYAPGARDFSTCGYAGSQLDCGRYGVIGGTNPDWLQYVPATSMQAGGDTLGSFLAKMVETGSIGYGREATGTGDDWSRTIDELIRVTGAQAFSYAAGFSGQRSRGRSAIAFVSFPDFFLGPYHNYWHDKALNGLPSGGRPERPETFEKDPEGGGISLLRIGIIRSDDARG